MAFTKNVTNRLHKVRDPYCTICETFLSGNGSYSTPWRCSCGEYKFDMEKFEYKLAPGSPNTGEDNA